MPTIRQVSLTSFGAYLLPLITAILDAQDELAKAAQAFWNPTHKLIRVGLSPLINTHLLATVLEPFRRAHPEIDVFFKECYLDDLEARLDSDKIDIAFAPRRPHRRGWRTCFFYEETLCYVPRESTPGSPDSEGPVRLVDVGTATFVLPAGGCGLADAVRELFRVHSLQLQEYPGQALSYKVLEDWAALGIGAAILPQSKLSPANRAARPLILASGQPATLVYEAVCCV